MKYPMVEFSFLKEQDIQEKGICHVLAIFERNVQPDVDYLMDKPYYHTLVKPLIETFQFVGKVNELVSTHCLPIQDNIILVGLGSENDVNQEVVRRAASLVYRACVKLKNKSIVVHFNYLLANKAYLQAFIEGILLSAHCDDRFKSKKDSKLTHIEKVCFLHAIEDMATVQLAQHIVRGVLLARELVNAPANYVTPTTLAETSMELAKKYPFEVHILEKQDCQKLGMGAYLSVTQGSDVPPKFIHLCYKPKQLDSHTAFKKIALIGKGVTFDAGGLNLKIGAAHIEDMKQDMAGAAALLGVAEAIGVIQPNKEIHFIIAATENMINGKATKPGDVVTASNGKTIEIDNTDAEGRLTLADALVYAEKLNVDAIVDLATLTGAMVVALGERMAGLFGTDQKLLDELLAASPRTGEKIWPMPLEEAYFESMQSIIADMRNTGDRVGGGSITAAMFLKQFVEKTPWAHIDIAGPVSTKKPWFYHNAGGTGFGVRLLLDWILKS